MTGDHVLSPELALRVRELRKVYRLYEKPTDRLKELLFQGARHRDFVALDGVSFSLPHGCTLGVLGDNGAGKSTLLQLVIGSLSPTSGTVETRGRVLGLLALGLGFHLEFSGRENIFFYGDMLGLSRGLMQERLAEIIAFSELEAFVDQPLKTYSTGMRLRLAFSLVASLDPDILIVDEALAVGDMHFQKKCIGRMMDIKNRGCTILFCSHSTYQVSMFCDQVMWLKNGRVEMLGEPAEVIPLYEAYQMRKDVHPLAHEQMPYAGTPVRIAELELLSPLPLRPRDDLCVRLRTQSERDDLPFHVTLSLKLDSGRGVFVTGTHLRGESPLLGREREIRVTFPAIPLMGGVYSLHARLFDDQGLMLYHERVLPDLEVRKDSRLMGICYLAHHWEVR